MGIEDIAATGVNMIGTVAVTKIAADTVNKVVSRGGRMPKTKWGNLRTKTPRTTRTPIKTGTRGASIFKMYSGKRKRY